MLGLSRKKSVYYVGNVVIFYGRRSDEIRGWKVSYTHVRYSKGLYVDVL